ncbi:MAG: nicotinamide mononucleotide transporter [Clostridiales bacterium]|nr:nicotinamide mononucleotide transporter [Clostridiales bacterium]
MKGLKKLITYFTITEICLWFFSIALIITSFCIFDRENYLTLFASIVGITALIFCAKGNPIGQVLMVFFSIVYGVISYSFRYYGEMLTYLGMTLPMATLALISWLKNPFKGKRSEVTVNTLNKKDFIVISISAILVTTAFYFILSAFNTANIVFSTISITTSFIAVFLTFKRSPYFALVYALNDVVLIVLWSLASLVDIKYISVVVCFIAFLVNDLYGFINWQKMKNRQNSSR